MSSEDTVRQFHLETETVKAEPQVPSPQQTPTPTSSSTAVQPKKQAAKRQVKKSTGPSKSSTPSGTVKKEKSSSKLKASPAKQPQHPRIPNLPFPRSFVKYNENSEELFCLCRRPDNGEFMIGCDGCDDWFHAKCVKVDMRYKDLIASFYCPYCELENKGKTLWKRKCRLEGCWTAISGPESKFCSKQHGLEYMREAMRALELRQSNEKDENSEEDRKELTKAELVQLIRHSSTYETLKNIGATLPDVSVDLENQPRLKKIDEDVADLEEKLKLESLRKQLLIKTRESVKRLSEEITAAMDTGTSKKKVKKVEVCGFDLSFNNEADFFKDMTEDDLVSKQTEQLKERFISLQPSDKDTEMEDLYPNICLTEKKKCLKHNGWQTMLTDEIDMNIQNLEIQMTKLLERKKSIIKVLKTDLFEQKAHVKQKQMLS